MEKALKTFWSSLKLLRMKNKYSTLGILVIGETGTGKSMLINNLVGEDVAEVGHTYLSETSTISKFTVDMEGVSIALYDTPGLINSRSDGDAEYLQQMEGVLKSGDIHLVIYCIKLSETRMRESVIRTFQEYNKIGVNWERTVIALTFADHVPVPIMTRRRPGFEMAHFFNQRVAEFRVQIISVLVERVGVLPEVASKVICCPTTLDPEEMLPNGKEWHVPFWLEILNLLFPDAAIQFQKRLTNNIESSSPKEATNDGTAPPLAEPPGDKHTPAHSVCSKGASPTPTLQDDSKFAGFTESECHALYQKAYTDKPHITLHIAKAMTIGPPRVGKTALRHLLLGLPLPAVSTSTPVMKTAETVGIISSDEMASSAENKPSRAIKADSELIQIGSEDKWVVVNETSGILSLLSHLKEGVEKAKLGDGIEKDAAVRMQSQVKNADSVQAPREETQPQAQLHVIDSNCIQVTSGPEQHKVKQPIAGTSPGATAEDSTHISATVSQLHQLLQTPDIANITLPDAKLLQFLDCGGQLAYHDILPIFTTIPAIYLHVFDLTQDLAACPKDQLCRDMAEGEVYSHARSPLTVAEMMTRSVMTIESLVDKRVQLPKGVLLSEPPQPQIAFVGTHLDELAQKSKNMKATFDVTSKVLQSTLRSESQSLEEMVMKSQDQRLPAMFLPVTCKQRVNSDVSSLAIKQLKGRIKALISHVKVKVPIKWYLYQMLEISRSKKEHTPVHRYRDLYKSCCLTKVVDDLREFHTMVTYFHALGLLIHACNEDADMHREDSTCLVFTDPSYLFENISRLFHVQFLEDIWCQGSLLTLKLQGKLTDKTLRDLEVDNTQLDYKAFMDVLVHFYIGAEIEDSAGKDGRTLFIPSILPEEDTSQPVVMEQTLHFAIAFNEKPFVPCGVYAGVIARLQSLLDWKIITASRALSRSHASFGVAAEDTVHLFNCSSHIRVELDACDGRRAQEYHDTVLTVVAESYCFLFHAKPTKGQPCTTCREDPYLELGLTCHHCEMKNSHIATLRLESGEAKTVRCTRTQRARRLHGEQLELFGSIQHDVSVHGMTQWNVQ